MPWLHLGILGSDQLKTAAYSAMDAFVIPSRAEAFGLTAIEALACGTAVAASRTGGLAEALFNGEGGLLFETGNPGALADAITLLLTHPQQRSALAAAGRTRVVERHASAKIAQQCLQLYQSILT